MSRDSVGPPTLAGTWFGEYHVLRRIGIGGMGTVYLAKHCGQNGVERLFAVKVLHDHLASDEAALSMLFDEARLAAQIHHPNVVAIHSLEHQRDRYYLVMEYIEGATLSQLFKRNPERRPPSQIIRILLDALHGLHAAHAAVDLGGNSLKLVHRDVSTDNILIGIDGTARIADFGIAKAVARTTSTQPGVRKGKYAFMAPEQVMGNAIDHRADLFALGIVAYNALTGTRLFCGPSDPATLHNIIYEQVRVPSEIGLCPPGELDPVVMRALERDPDARYQSAAEMIADLQRAALACGLHGSRLGLGSWVQDTFCEELLSRRQAVRPQTDEDHCEFVTDLLSEPTEICTPPTVQSSRSVRSGI